MATDLILKQQEMMQIDEMLELAGKFVDSKFFPKDIDTPEKALVVMMTGRDLGVTFTEALQSISVVKQRPCISAKLLLGMCYRTKAVEDVKIESHATECKVTIKRKNKSPYTSHWTLEKAEKMGIMCGYKQNGEKYTKDNWAKQPENMLRWRAISEAVRFTFPDAISGCYIAEELADEVIVAPAKPGEDPEIVEVVEHQPQPQAEDPAAVSGINDMKADDIAEEELGNWIIPGGVYKGQRISDVVFQETPSGRLKGLEYLDEMAETAKDLNAREVIKRYTHTLRREGWLPQDSYDAKDVPNKFSPKQLDQKQTRKENARQAGQDDQPAGDNQA